MYIERAYPIFVKDAARILRGMRDVVYIPDRWFESFARSVADDGWNIYDRYRQKDYSVPASFYEARKWMIRAAAKWCGPRMGIKY